MRGKVTFLGHQLHPMLVAFPIACLALAPFFDLAAFASNRSLFGEVGFWLLTCGLVGALLAAVPGLVDLLELPRDTRAWRVGLTHMGVMLGVVTLDGISWVLRLMRSPHTAGSLELTLMLLAFAVLVVGGWFGAELVERHGYGVHSDAELNAPSSLDAERFAPRRPPTMPTEPRPV